MARSSRLSRLTEDTRSTRRRRSEPKERKPLKKKARRSYMSEDRSMPPVMVRGDFTWMPQSVRKRNKTRRRYDVALNIPGAEMRPVMICQPEPSGVIPVRFILTGSGLTRCGNGSSGTTFFAKIATVS